MVMGEERLSRGDFLFLGRLTRLRYSWTKMATTVKDVIIKMARIDRVHSSKRLVGISSVSISAFWKGLCSLSIETMGIGESTLTDSSFCDWYKLLGADLFSGIGTENAN